MYRMYKKKGILKIKKKYIPGSDGKHSNFWQPFLSGSPILHNNSGGLDLASQMGFGGQVMLVEKATSSKTNTTNNQNLIIVDIFT